jgi:hypothetical protein
MNVFQKIKKIDVLIYYEDLYISIIYIEMNYNYYNIFNDIHKLQQQIIEHENKIDELKEHYENKINEIKNQEQTYILEPVKTSNYIQPDNLNYILYNDNDKNNVIKTIGKFKIEPLTLMIKNNTAHLYGFIQGAISYIIPSHINTNSIEPRLLYKESPRFDSSVHPMNYNVILWNGIVRLYTTTSQYGYNYDKAPNYDYLTVNIHFNL